MKGIDWGYLYDDFKDETLDPIKLEEEVRSLMIDDEVQKKKEYMNMFFEEMRSY